MYSACSRGFCICCSSSLFSYQINKTSQSKSKNKDLLFVFALGNIQIQRTKTENTFFALRQQDSYIEFILTDIVTKITKTA